MTSKFLAALVLGLAVSAGARAATDENWDTFSPVGGAFKVLMPTTPTTDSKELPSPFGKAKITTHTAASEDGRAFMIAALTMPVDISALGSSGEMLDSFVGGMAQGFKGKVVSQKTIKLGDYAGKEFEATALEGKSTFRGRAYVVKDKIFVVGVLAAKDSAEGDSVEKFLDSFELVQAP
jgi:hypothetical protein